MNKLKTHCQKVLLDYSQKGKEYSAICCQLEAALREVSPSDALQLLEFLEALYPQSPDLAYATAVTLYRSEQYQAAWKVLLLSSQLPHEPLSDSTRNVPPQSVVSTTHAAASRFPSASSSSSSCSRSQDKRAPTKLPKNFKNKSRTSSNTGHHDNTFTSYKCEQSVKASSHTTAHDKTSTNSKREPSAVTVKASLTVNHMRDPRFRSLHAGVVNVLMDRWHIPMINDVSRNRAFKRAIENVVAGSSCQSPKYSGCTSKATGSCGASAMLGNVSEAVKQMINSGEDEPSFKSGHSSGGAIDLTSSRKNDTRMNKLGKATGRADDTHSSSHTAAIRCPTTPSENVPACSVSVLDIGCGSGLLSVYASRAGAGQVCGCDSSELMCELARAVCADNLTTSRHDEQAQDVPPTSSYRGAQQHHDSSSQLHCGGFDITQEGHMRPKQQPQGIQSAVGSSLLETTSFSNSEGNFSSLKADQSLEAANSLNGTKFQTHPSASLSKWTKKSTEKIEKMQEHTRKFDDVKKRVVSPDIINLHSKDLFVGSNSLCERVQLVVAETVDAAILGEKIVETLIDAWQRLLLPHWASNRGATLLTNLSTSFHDTINIDGINTPASCEVNSLPAIQASKRASAITRRVIPGRAEAYACLIECDYICRYTKHVRPRPSDSLERGDVKPALLPDGDLYNTERLELLPGGYTELTRWYKVFEIDFNSLEDLKLIAHGGKEKYFSMRCFKTGRLDAIALAFKLYVDEENTLETFPYSGSCWETAVYPERMMRNLGVGETVVAELKSSDFLRLKTVQSRPLLSILKSRENSASKCRECVAQHAQHPCPCQGGFAEILVTEFEQIRKEPRSNFNESVTENSEDESLEDCEISTSAADPELFLDSAGMRAFNSTTYNSALTTAARLMAEHLAANRNPSQPVRVYDETPFPIATLILSELLPEISACVTSNCARDYLAYNHVQAIVVSVDDVVSQLPDSPSFDAMFMWPISEVGLLDDTLEEKMLFCRQCLSRPGAVFPSSISVFLAALSSPALEGQTRAQDTNTHGVRLQGLLDMLQTTHHLDILLDTLPHRQLCAVVSPLTIAFPYGKFTRHPFLSETHIQRKPSGKNKLVEANCSRFGSLYELYRPEEGWDSAEGCEVMALHERGLLCSGRNLFESEVRVTALNAGILTGIGHWFGLSGITCRNSEGDLTVLGVPVPNMSSSFNEILEDDFILQRDDRKSYFEQTIRCFKTITGSHTAKKLETNIEKVSDRKDHAIQQHSSINGVTAAESSSSLKLSASLLTPSFSLPTLHASLPTPSASLPMPSASYPTPSTVLHTPCASYPTTSASHDVRKVGPTVELFTVGPESPCSQACFLLQDHLEVQTGECLTLDFVYKEGCFWAEAFVSDQRKD